MKKKINFYIHTLGVGGAEKALVNLVNNLDKEKYEVTVTTIINTGKYLKELDTHIKKKTVVRIPKIILNKLTNKTGTLEKSDNLNFPKKIVQTLYYFFWRYFSFLTIPIGYIQNMNSDIIVSFLEGPTHIFVSRIPTNAKKIGWIHVDLSEEKKSECFFTNLESNRKSYNSYTGIVAVSNKVKDSLKDYLKIKTSIPVTFLSNVYDDEEIIALSKEEVYPINKKDLNIISVGRLSKQKGYDRLIQAVARNKNSNLTYEVNIYGDGEEREALENQILELELKDVIKLRGFTDNPYKYIRDGDVFIASSRTEGYSTVVVESLIIGTPVIVTDCSGMKEIIGENEYGNIVDNSIEGMSDALYKLLNDKKYLLDLKEKAASGSDRFKMEKLINEIESYFEEIVRR